MNLSLKKSLSFCALFFLFCFLTSIYLPLIIYGGIITDDWGDIAHNLGCTGFWHCYQTWFPLFSNRPLAPLPITLSTFLFGTHMMGYLIANSFIYLLAIFITAKVILEINSLSSAIIFATIAAIPCIAMPLLTSPINQLTATISFLYWAISLYSLLQYCKKENFNYYIASYLFLLLGFLTYEVILPLLVLTIFLPTLVPNKLHQFKLVSYARKFLLPVVLIIISIILWQKIIAPQFMAVDSRLKFDAGQALNKLHTWFHVFYAQLPRLFAKSFGFISSLHLISCVLVTLTFLFSVALQVKNNFHRRNSLFFVICLGCFLASSAIFILSNESAVSWGYQARGLSSTWFSLALLLASISTLITLQRAIIKVIGMSAIAGITCLSTLVFLVQRDNYIASWQLQKIIIEDALGLIENSTLPFGSEIIANVPKFTPNNFNGELVFSQSWDFPAALAIYSYGRVVGGTVIDSRSNNWNGFKFDGKVASINDGWKSSSADLWFYDFDQKTQKGTLLKIEDHGHFIK
ncbi:hypothetical protein [Polynucleobacter sp. IMCC 29146]|uniref:hypothetical protein n=1 Tax=Polynucleobacter sp. IMCC 29146 TaxID=2780953 RepID=UPI001F2D70CA|nr:hypothetical protein [Polynucleobacter sp. IMCC 29146]MCE7530677.1 hypothetical protein [Polynucleobacter sp. IMCC 29146]